MGCDFFYDGQLPDETKQVKVINFVKDYFKSIDLFVDPNPSESYSTEVRGPFVRFERVKRCFDKYPFNYFGFIPNCKWEYGITTYGQFIFDRNDNGKLVKIYRLPDSFGILPEECFQEEVGRDQEETNTREDTPQHSRVKPYGYQVILEEGGYTRLGGGRGFALMLVICKMRWWPDLSMSDDYGNCEDVEALIARYGLEKTLRDERLNFDACYNLLTKEYDKDFPPPSQAKNIVELAQQYLDYEEKLKPYRKPATGK